MDSDHQIIGLYFYVQKKLSKQGGFCSYKTTDYFNYCLQGGGTYIMTRPVNVQVFMYPGRVWKICGRVPGYPQHQACTEIKEARCNTRFIDTLAYLKYNFFWHYLLLFCLFVMTLCKNQRKHHEKCQNLLSVNISTQVFHKVNSYPDPHLTRWVPGYFCLV